ncbi:protein YIF1B-like [Tripterygium wilfordii]|uniref:Protein YIF1B-like n=2 Tax=Tripterygium wilfordii TaxID=458696 RepID=A0A7J7DT11_TRIWF|nr:protein YIF1B-like [Tripterygium wilfordii]
MQFCMHQQQPPPNQEADSFGALAGDPGYFPLDNKTHPPSSYWPTLTPVDAIYGVGSDLIRSELGAYGETLLGSGSAYVQTNISRYLSNPRYYFQVNDDYVKNKLKVILFPFLHRGHWMRATEKVGGRSEFSYKPPVYDINAPDLYIPLMAFGTYLVLAGFLLGINGK